MSYPIVPVPQWLQAIFHITVADHVFAANIGALLFGSFGAIFLVVYVIAAQDPENPWVYKQLCRQRIRECLCFVGMAVAFVIFGYYLFALLMLLLAVALVYAVVRGIQIALEGI